MPFSRTTILAAIDALRGKTVAEFERFLLQFSLEEAIPSSGVSMPHRRNALATHLIRNPQLTGPRNGDLMFEILEFVINEHRHYMSGEVEGLTELQNSLIRDGYQIHNGKLQSILPQLTAVPNIENEVELLLDKYNFTTAKGHLTQALAAHTRSDWAAANSQFRPFIESVFDEIAGKLLPPPLPPDHNSKKVALAQLTPPFLDPGLNEWVLNGNGGFVQGFYKRLHPQGSHPGLSDQDDCNFRMHLVLLVSHHFLKRMDERMDATVSASSLFT